MATRQEPAAALVSPEQPAAPQTGRVGPPWKTAVLNRLERLRSEPIDPDRTRWVVGIEAEPSEKPVFVLDRFNELLASAENQVARVGVWRELVTFFTGDRIERAWSDLHAADELLVLMQSDETVRAKIPELRANVTSRLPKSLADEYLKQLAAVDAKTRAFLRPEQQSQIRQIRQTLNRVSDEAHGRVRSFRNVVLLVIALLSTVLLFIAVDPPSWLPICGPATAEGAMTSCPEAWQVMLLGALGGTLAGYIALQRLSGSTVPYGLPMTMAVAKIPVGATTGLLAALLIQNDVIGVFEPQPANKILAFAAFFGFAQEAFLRYVDGHAQKLLGEAQGASQSS